MFILKKIIDRKDKVYSPLSLFLIIDKDLMIRELVDVACLDWEENCLDFHKNKRIVKTASDQQVRNKIYTKSIDKWKNYKTLLNPVIDKVNNINYEQSN